MDLTIVAIPPKIEEAYIPGQKLVGTHFFTTKTKIKHVTLLMESDSLTTASIWELALTASMNELILTAKM